MFDDSMIGVPDVQADFCEQQIFDDNCAVVAETSIINQFCPGLNLSQEEAAYISASNGWYHPGAGTGMDDVGHMMDIFGVGNHANTNATAMDLALELQQGHGVIVSVNSAELWDTGPLAELKHAICKACGLDNPHWNPADHAVTITGIDVSDPDHPMAIVNDSGVGCTMKYPLDKFIDAWENGGCCYVATNEPLPSMPLGKSYSGFWDRFDLPEVVSKSASLITGAIVGWATDDAGIAAASGMAAGRIVSSLFDNESFMRSI